jgi:hypothetical protein
MKTMILAPFAALNQRSVPEPQCDPSTANLASGFRKPFPVPLLF